MKTKRAHFGQSSCFRIWEFLILTEARYHSHSDLQRADGLYGGLIVHNPIEKGESEVVKRGYDDEILLLIGDWYHRSAEEVQASYVTHDSWGREVWFFFKHLLQSRLSNHSTSRCPILSWSTGWELLTARWQWLLVRLNASKSQVQNSHRSKEDLGCESSMLGTLRRLRIWELKA